MEGINKKKSHFVDCSVTSTSSGRLQDEDEGGSEKLNYNPVQLIEPRLSFVKSEPNGVTSQKVVKTPAERAKEYRMRKKLGIVKTKSKSSTDKSREFPDAKQPQLAGIIDSQNDFDHPTMVRDDIDEPLSFVKLEPECIINDSEQDTKSQDSIKDLPCLQFEPECIISDPLLITKYPKVVKTPAERAKEYRLRKKLGIQKKKPKSSSERSREFVARQIQLAIETQNYFLHPTTVRVKKYRERRKLELLKNSQDVPKSAIDNVF